MPIFPLPIESPTAHFSAAEFFRDSPWLNVPPHRKAEIMVEPLYPRLGLLGGNPENGKVSKLAALAAARKEKEKEAAEAAPKNTEQGVAPKLSLKERLAASTKPPRQAEGLEGLRRLGKPATPKPSPVPSTSPVKPAPVEASTKPTPAPATEPNGKIEHASSAPLKRKWSASELRLEPSHFATVIVGSPPTIAKPSQRPSTVVDFTKLYNQGNAKPYDFSDPSPDDIVLKAQSTAKGLAFRRKV